MQKIHAMVVCPSTKGYTDQQLIAGRATHASFAWLNREREETGTHKERRLTRAGSSVTDPISPVPMADAELDLSQQTAVLPLAIVAQNEQMYVRPEHPTTARSMTSEGQVKPKLPFCSDILHVWAMNLVNRNPTALTKMDPLSSPDLLFPMPTRSKPLYHVTPKDVKLLMRPSDNHEQAEALTSAWEGLIALFFAIAQTMRLWTEHEQINTSPYASYHQHALVSPETLTLILPEKLQTREDDHNPPMTVHGLSPDHKQAQAIVSQWSKEIHACNVRKTAVMATMTYNCEYYTPSSDAARYPRLKILDIFTCGLASTVARTTPTMEAIADWGVEVNKLGYGFQANQQFVMPFYQAYQEVRKSIFARLGNIGPMETLRYGLSKDAADWNEVIFVSETQVIEELATNTLTERGIGTKSIANFTRMMRFAFGKRKASVASPKRKPTGVKAEASSPGPPAEELEGPFQGFIP